MIMYSMVLKFNDIEMIFRSIRAVIFLQLTEETPNIYCNILLLYNRNCNILNQDVICPNVI